MRKYRPYLLLTTVLSFSLFSCSSSHNQEEVEREGSAYLSKVFDYSPAVGQFVNVLPIYSEGDTSADMVRKAEEAIKGERPLSLVSLGGFGGSILFGFDHMVENRSGYCDFRVLGNAFSSKQPSAVSGSRGGSSEPGIIWVSYDANGNGLPDDAWYEIVGSEQGRSTANYEITYHRPTAEASVESNNPNIVNSQYIRWEDNQGNGGYKSKNKFNTQSYYPQWIDQDALHFEGRLLPNNAENRAEQGAESWFLTAFDYGYADNAANSEPASAIDIDWAVDAQGRAANLPGIHFVKVYTGVNQEAGWTGEISTEVGGAYDLHFKGETIKSTPVNR